MTFDKRTRARLLAHCGELHDDDGLDPRRFFQTSRRSRQRDRKTLQLCRQVGRTLDLVLGGDFGDELLQNLQVDAVEPGADARQLTVTVRPASAATAEDLETIRERLEKVSGRLRTEVAESITRKLAPKLVFRVVNRPAAGEASQ